MKKENRQMAQERRAEERKRLELKKKRNKFLKIAVPIVLILLLVMSLLWTVSKVLTAAPYKINLIIPFPKPLSPPLPQRAYLFRRTLLLL